MDFILSFILFIDCEKLNIKIQYAANNPGPGCVLSMCFKDTEKCFCSLLNKCVKCNLFKVTTHLCCKNNRALFRPSVAHFVIFFLFVQGSLLVQEIFPCLFRKPFPVCSRILVSSGNHFLNKQGSLNKQEMVS